MRFRRKFSVWLSCSCGTFARLFAFLGAACMFFGSFDRCSQFLMGARIFVDTIDVGTVATGDTADVKINVASYAWRPVTLLGLGSSCGCLGSPDLPMTIDPWTVKRLTVTTSFASLHEGDTFSVPFVLFSNLPGQTHVRSSVCGSVGGGEGATNLPPQDTDRSPTLATPKTGPFPANTGAP